MPTPTITAKDRRAAEHLAATTRHNGKPLSAEERKAFVRLWLAKLPDHKNRLRAIKQRMVIESEDILAARAEQNREADLVRLHAEVFRDRLGRPLEPRDLATLVSEISEYIGTKTLQRLRNECDEIAKKMEKR